MGKYLAKTIQKNHPNLAVDVVIAVPDLARTVAIATADELGKPYHEGFVKNHLMNNDDYTQSTAQSQAASLSSLSPINLEFKDKNVLLVDISVVRGNNSREIIRMVRAAGAKKVYFASAAPKIQYSSVYGVDMPVYTQLIAHNRNDQQIAEKIGADLIIYQTLADLKQALRDINPELHNFEASCFDGYYITQDIDEDYLQSLANGVNH
jgi:amidophosphoribosyltransferase